jgi:sarcosine oxidase gamma subunit
MRDINKMIEHIEQTTWGSRDRRSSQPADKPKPSPHAWRAPDAVLRPASPAEREAHRRFEGAANALVARAVKVTVPLDPAAVAALEVREGGPPRLRLTIAVEGGVLQADVAAKAVRKAQRTLVENSPDAIFCQLIGKLVKNEIVECGLVAQVKIGSK